MKSVKGNVILNGLNTITGIIFPVITFPYAARVLLPDGIGSVNFLNSIINYIVLLTSLGIPVYAVKEVAKYRDDVKNRDKVVLEILGLSLILCIFGYIAVYLLARFVPEIHSQASLFYVLSLSIVFTSIGVNWFYQGIEDFKFITVRGIIVRFLSAIALFAFVKDESDILVYGLIVVGSTVGNNIINFVHLRKHLSLTNINFKGLNVTRHIKPTLKVFILNLIVSLYIQLNTIMLGFISGDEAVGYYTAGTKITHIAVLLITSMGTVLLPRCSYLIQVGDKEKFKSVIKKSLDLTLALSIPIAVGLMVLAVPVTLIFCGDAYMPSIPVLYLNAPVIIIVSLTNLLGIQILYSMDKLNIVILSVGVGAFANIILNILLVPTYAATGTAISVLVSEGLVLVVQMISGRRYYPFKLRDLFNFKYFAGSILMAFAIYVTNKFVSSDVIKILAGIAEGAGIYFAYLYFLKDPLLFEFKSTILNKIRHVN